MASTESKIRLIFEGVERGVVAAAAKARAAVKSLGDDNDKASKAFEKLDAAADKAGRTLLNISKGILVLGTAAGTGHVIAGIVVALAQLVPIALVLPGVLLGAGAAFGTLAIAMGGFSDAIAAGLHNDLAFFNKAVAAMPPPMQEAAKAVVAFKPQLDDLKRTVQGNFWQGFSTEITKLGNSLLPVLKRGMGDIATNLGSIGREALKAANTPFFQGAVGRILANTALAIGNMKSALANVLTGFVDLGDVGARFLPRIGTAITNITASFKNWVAANNEVGGTIDRLIEGAIQGFKDLGGIVFNVIGIVSSIFRGLGTSFESPLASLRDLTGQLKDFLRTAEAQEGLRALGEILQEAGAAVKEVFLAALKELLPTLEVWAPAIKAIIGGLKDFALQLISVLGPALRAVGGFLSENAAVLRVLVPLIAGAVVAYKGFRVLTEIAGWAKAAQAALVALNSSALVTAVRGTALATVLKRAAGVVGFALIAAEIDKVNVAAAGGAENLTGMQEQLHDFVAAGQQILSGDFAGIFADIDAEVQQLNSTWAAGQAPIQQWFTSVGDGISSALSAIGGFLASLPGMIGGALASLGSTIASAASTAWNSLVTATSTAITTVVGFVTGLPAQIGALLSSLGGFIASTAATAWNSLVTATQTAVTAVVAFVTDLPFKVGFALGVLIGTIANLAITAWNGLVTATTTAINSVVSFVTALPGRVGAALAALGSTIVAVATSAWQSFLAAVQAGANAAINFVRSVPGAIAGALSALGSTIANVATAAWNAFTNAIRTAFNATLSFIRSIPGAIVSALSALAGMLSSTATSAGNAFTNAIRTGFNAAVSFVRGIPGAIVGALGNLGGLLVGAGRALIDGLTAGMRAGYQALLNFARGIAAGIAAVKGPLPKDKVLLIPAGLAIMQGLRAGMSRGLDDVLALAASTAGRVADSLAASSSLQFAGAGVNVTAPSSTAGALQQLLSLQSRDQAAPQVRVFIGDRELTDLVRTEITSSNRLTRRTVTAGAGTTF